MTHLTERIAEFVFEELPASEMADARRHLAGCSDCHEQVKQFQLTHAMLRTSADVEPPRRIMFEFEKPQVTTWIWRWLAPMAASAAVAFAVVTFTPRPQSQIVERVEHVSAPTAVQPVAAEAVDYPKIEAWLTSELNKRDAATRKDFLRVQGQIDLLDRYQRITYREIAENQRDFQLLAQKTESR